MRSKRLGMLGLLSVFLLAGLMSTANLEARDLKAEVIYMNLRDVADWDPAWASDREAIKDTNVYETLLRYNSPGSKDPFTPTLATSWDVTPDGQTWTFHLRKGVKFHDGEPFNAAAVKYSIERNIKEKKASYFIWDPLKEIKIIDDYTVQFICKYPAAIDLISTSNCSAWIYSPKGTHDWFMQGNGAGTGPYKVQKWEKDQQVILTKNDSYWGGWKGNHFERVIIKAVAEKATQIQMMKSGEADFASDIPVDSLAELKRSPGVEVLTPPSWKNLYFLINTKKFPTDNLKVRQAICYAWDYDTVANSIYNGLAEVAQGPVPKTMWGHNPNVPQYKFDLAKAKMLIEESGIPKDKIKFRLAYTAEDQERKSCAELLQANLKKIGIDMELTPGQFNVLWDQAKKLETAANINVLRWWPSYPTPVDWLYGIFESTQVSSYNMSHYANPKVDSLIKTGMELEGKDRQAAIKAYQEVQKTLVEDAVAIFAGDLRDIVPKAKSIKGYVYNPGYNSPFFYELYRE